ncbi:MAG: hypothetical protein Q4G62_04175 [Pseudomonadota bacterium]|nr:hypothetical protein [Pseudomonadota bacterium]
MAIDEMAMTETIQNVDAGACSALLTQVDSLSPRRRRERVSMETRLKTASRGHRWHGLVMRNDA